MDLRAAVQVERFQQRMSRWIAGCAFVVFLICLRHFPTFEALAALVKATGRDWHVNLVAPLHQILTYPLRWISPAVQPWALNAMGAGFAAITLGLLSRSVGLLSSPQSPAPNRPWWHQPSLWIPSLFAVMICGLQLTFWENAVAATGESFDVMVFAWLVLQLLAYRQRKNPRRLSRFAFVYGLATANNYAMIALFPAFLIAFLWMVGRDLWRWRQIRRIVGWGVAGLALYVLLPELAWATDRERQSFWNLLQEQWALQWFALQAVPRYIFVICSLTSLIPILYIGVIATKRAGDGKLTAVGRAINSTLFWAAHLGFLVVCTGAAFDPIFGARQLVKGRVALLPLFYLGALAAGYFIHYLLRRLEHREEIEPEPVPHPMGVASRKAAAWALAAGAGVVMLALGVKTLTTVSDDSARQLHRMTRAMVESLPAEGAVVLSDDILQLYSVQAELLTRATRDRYALIDSGSLLSPEYHRYLAKTYPKLWPKFLREPDPNKSIDAPNLMNALLRVDQTSSLCYLHPSYGLFFEFFEARPQGMVYRLVRSPTNALSGGPMSVAELDRQHAYLQEHVWGEVETLAAQVRDPRDPATSQAARPAAAMAEYLAAIYSRMLNQFGVELKRAGDLERATTYFHLASKLKPSNAAALINVTHTDHLRTGQAVDPDLVKRVGWGEGRWEMMLKVDGPFDEPVSCLNLARAFGDSGLFRQAGRELERVLHYAPDNRSARMDHGMMCIRSGLADQAEAALAAYRQRFDRGNLDPREDAELLSIQAWAGALRRNLPAAEEILHAAQKKLPGESMPWDTLVEIYLRFGRESNAVQVMERRLQAQPNNVAVLANYGGLKMRLGQYTEALETIDRALKIEPTHQDARFNRALAHAALKLWEPAQQDFQILINTAGARRRLQSLYGLAEVSYQKSNRQESLIYYQQYLEQADTGAGLPSPEVQSARDRLRTLEAQLAYETLAQPGYVVPATGQLRH